MKPRTTSVSEQHIDIHNHDRGLQCELEGLENDCRLLEANRASIARFVHDAMTGKTVRRGRVKRLGAARCRKLVYSLRRFAMELGVPFEDASVADIERIVLGLEDGDIGRLVSSHVSTRYSASTVLDIKKVLRKFYRWLFPTAPQRVEELTGWFDMRDEPPELRTFGLDEARRMASATGSAQGRALVMVLFDSGMRAGEILNIRLGDLSLRREADGTCVAYARIRVSKTKARTISLPLATDDLFTWIRRHPEGGGVDDLAGEIRAKNLQAPLFTWTYSNCRKVLRRVGRVELGERMYFHRFRHSSATWYAKTYKFSEYQLCARYGWVIGSSAPQRYIEVSGILAEETAHVVRQHQNQSGLRSERSHSRVSELLTELRENPELLDLLRLTLRPGSPQG